MTITVSVTPVLFMTSIERAAKEAMKRAEQSKARKNGQPYSKGRMISFYIAAAVGFIFSIILANHPDTVADGKSWIFYLVAVACVGLCVYIALGNKKKKASDKKNK